MLRYLLLALGSFGLINNADCAISAWTADTVAKGTMGTEAVTACLTVAEGATLSVTMAATAAAGDLPVAYTIAQPTGLTGTYTFAIDSSTGVLTLPTGTLDAETDASIVLAITATDAASNTGTLTCTLTVSNINDNIPVFVIPNSCLQIASTLTANSEMTAYISGTGGTALATRTATDADTADNAISAYAITAASNTNSDFAIGATTGAITNANALAATTTSMYTLVITAADSATPASIGTATLTVCVGSNCCSGTASIVISSMTLMSIVLVLFM